MSNKESNPVRLDKWLWAARFYKTRSLAGQALDQGRVWLGGERAKASRVLRVGDTLRIRTEHGEFEVVVCALSVRREGAEQARLLYLETDKSIEARAQRAFEARLAPQFDHPDIQGRPTKKWRRDLERIKRGD